MVFSLSPSVEVLENSVDATFTEVAATGGAFCGAFNWGPVEEIKTISSEAKLIDTFAKPDTTNITSWWSAANFLAYGNNLKIVRVVGSNAINACTGDDVAVENFTGDASTVDFTTVKTFTKLPSSLNIFINDEEQTSEKFTYELDESNHLVVTFTDAPEDSAVILVKVNHFVIKNIDDFNSKINLNDDIYAKYPGDIANGLTIYIATHDNWEEISAKKIFSYKPSENEISIAIVGNGKLGTNNSVIWYKELLSKDTNEPTNYYKTYVNNNCPYIWIVNDLTGTPHEMVLKNGITDNNVSDSDRIKGYDLFKSSEAVDFRVLISGEASTTLANHLISNIAEYRKDCVAFISPDMESINNLDLEKSIIEFKNSLPSSSYYFMDGNWKYQYNQYDDSYVWVPMNADVAGLYVRTANDNEPWFSPAGYNRGIIKNVIKLKWNPDKTSRDELYSNGVNPIIIENGFGALLLGDKTGLNKPSSFSRINVRMLFIILEKAIATFAKYSLFEFNDDVTRASFRNRTSNYLSNVAGRRGIEDDYVVKCDEENNDATVINANGFVGEVKVRPLRSINFIKLTFSSYDYGVEFDETNV